MESLIAKPGQIDINCDTGEGVGNEAELLPLVSSCNIACGGHAGNAESMEQVTALAMRHGVRIGAHPSYPDRAHFGRRSLDLPVQELRHSLQAQVAALEAVLEARGGVLHHIKAHGALYNDLAANPQLGDSYLEILQAYRGRVLLFAPCGSFFATQARNRGFGVWEEAFADRAYRADGSLASRQLEGAVLTEPEQVWQQLRKMVLHHRAGTLDGVEIPIKAQTYCLHGDTPSANKILTYLSGKLREESIRLAK